jgi:hypothetical protein
MFSHRLVTALIAAGLLALPTGGMAAHIVTERVPYQITGIRAHLFYHDRGTFSDDLLTRRELVLWNTIIGDSEAGGASTATLIVVEVAGPTGAYEEGRRVELAVTGGGRTLLRRQASLGVLNAQGRTFAAFWLYDTGCTPLRISAALLGQPDPSRRRAEIPFRCGE